MMSNSNNQLNISQACEAMDRFKIQAGVNLTNGYNGHLTSQEAGSVGSQMVKNVCPVQNSTFERKNRTLTGYVRKIAYIGSITV